METGQYQAILFAPDGEYVTDFRGKETIQEVWDEINDMGSRWIFYPICCVGTEKTIVDAPEGMEIFKHRRIKTVKAMIKENEDEIIESLNNNWPLFHIFPMVI